MKILIQQLEAVPSLEQFSDRFGLDIIVTVQNIGFGTFRYEARFDDKFLPCSTNGVGISFTSSELAIQHLLNSLEYEDFRIVGKAELYKFPKLEYVPTRIDKVVGKEFFSKVCKWFIK